MSGVLFDYQNYHLVGIKGVGMTALALILTDMGKTVTGSDVVEVFLTDQLLKQQKIRIYPDFNEKNVIEAQVIVFSGANQGLKNLEVVSAKEKGLMVISLAELLGELSKLKKTVAVCGCHGKTTTTALGAYVGEKLKINISHYVGALGFMNCLPGKWAQGKYFITEADEYVVDPKLDRTSKFLYLRPQYIVCTNIDFDHPDVFYDLKAVQQSYLQFFTKLIPSGRLIINGDDELLVTTARQSSKPYITYGFNPTNDYHIQELEKQKYGLFFQKKLVTQYQSLLMGRHNALNCAAILILYFLLGYRFAQITTYLAQFNGVKRRMEFCDQIAQNYVFDDYAHHPSEIKATLKGFRQAFPDHKIALVFQPHTFSRTKKFFNQFVDSLRLADEIALLPIFQSAREQKTKHCLTSADLVADLKQRYKSQAQLISKDQDLVNLVKDNQPRYFKWLYITMGAGNVYLKNNIISRSLNEYYQ